MLFDDNGLKSETKLMVNTEYNEDEGMCDFYLCLSRDKFNPKTGTEIYVGTMSGKYTMRELVDIYLSQNHTPWEKEQRTHDFIIQYVENYSPPKRKQTYGRVLARGKYNKRPRETKDMPVDTAGERKSVIIEQDVKERK